MLKGKTRIELRNAETGELEEVREDENLITHAIDYIIDAEMSYNAAPNDYCLPVATKLLGGIMLFDDELDEDVDNIHFPVDVHLVGYAGQTVNPTLRKSLRFQFSAFLNQTYAPLLMGITVILLITWNTTRR